MVECIATGKWFYLESGVTYGEPWASLLAQMLKIPPTMRETRV